MIALERSYSFAASHFYYRPEWSEEENARTFGKCANRPAHGHNYRLTVRVSGSVDLRTGFAVDLPFLDGRVKTAILDRLDHRHVNDAIAEFGPGGLIPTTECLAEWMAREIGAALPAGTRLIELRLQEDDRLASVWWPD